MPDRCLKDQINVLKCFLVLKKGMEFGGLFWGTDILGLKGGQGLSSCQGYS